MTRRVANGMMCQVTIEMMGQTIIDTNFKRTGIGELEIETVSCFLLNLPSFLRRQESGLAIHDRLSAEPLCCILYLKAIDPLADAKVRP